MDSGKGTRFLGLRPLVMLGLIVVGLVVYVVTQLFGGVIVGFFAKIFKRSTEL